MEMRERSFEEIGKKQDNAEPENKKERKFQEGGSKHQGYMWQIIEKARDLQKNIYFCFIDYAKAFDCVHHKKLENCERDGNTRPPDLPLEKPICRSGSNS